MLNQQIYEKNENILWTLTGEGILLHHLESHEYLELSKAERFVWEYLDGAHNVDEILSYLYSNRDSLGLNDIDISKFGCDFIGMLKTNNFICFRGD